MKLPQQILTIISDLCSKDWIKFLSKDSNIYIVGGAVRDAFLNKPIKDVDIIVEGLSLQTIAKKLSSFGKVSLVGESFAVIKFKPNNESEYIDIAVPRIDRKISSGHKGFSVETNNISIKDDLKRRDFTVNSIAINIITKQVIDPFNGVSDLNKGLLRATDSNSFIEDPLRIFRGIQFSSRFNFSVER
jgi:tRNA nucleotidyltransferase (CCA-adding enzyme)